MPLTRRRFAAATLAPLLWPVDQAHAQSVTTRGYPDRPVRVIVPFAAGGGNDTLARLYGQKMAERLGQPVVVENRPGALGLIGADAAMRSRPDGYTLMVHPSGPVLHDRGAEKPPYDLAKDFVPVAVLGTFAALVVTAADSPHKNLTEMLAWARANPGRGTYGTGGVAFRMFIEMLNLRARTRFEYVAFRSSADAVTSAAAGEVTFASTDVGPATPALDGRRVRALAVFGPQRLPALLDAPTMAEAGFEGLDKISWIGLFAPAGTPAEIVTRLAELAAEAGRDPELQRRLATYAITPDARSPQAFQDTVLSDDQFWREAAARAGVPLER